MAFYKLLIVHGKPAEAEVDSALQKDNVLFMAQHSTRLQECWEGMHMHCAGQRWRNRNRHKHAATTHLSEQLAADKQDDKALLYFRNRKLMQKFRDIATELQETCDNLAE